MSGIGPDRRLGYKLIPQSNSEDSELSDEELHSLYRDGFQIITKKHVYSSDSSKKKRAAVSRNQNTRMMSPEEVEVKASRIFPTLKKDNLSPNAECMSMKRKFSFGFSIFICLFCIVLFLMLPCEWANCSYSSLCTFREIWQRVIVSIELRGPIVLLHTANSNNLNFLLMARGSIFADAPVIRTNYTSSSGGDVLTFDGLTSNQIWRKHFNKMPSEIDCALFSIKNQLPKDCVIVSYGNYITVVSAETGKTFWSYALTSRNNKTKEMFPLIVPDKNKDNVSDFLTVKDANKLLLISGFNGAVLDSDFHSMSHNCTAIKDLNIREEFMLKLSCKVENTYKNVSLSMKDHLGPAASSSEQVFPQHNSSWFLNKMHVHGYYIDIMNDGFICPRKCKSRVLIRNNKNKTVWSHQSDYSFVMTPISFDLMNHTAGVYGFIFKIWEHEHEDTEIKKMKMRHNNVKLTVSFLYERTVIVAFNSSFSEPIQIINMSYNPILQLYDANKSIQPDPVSQKYSLTLADVGKNGSCQIITYYSTFEDDKRDNYTYSDYTLKSYIRMYDLEKEVSRGLNITSI